MILQSEFKNNTKLRNCAVNNPDHISEIYAPKGDWVILIKKALNTWSLRQNPSVLPLLAETDIFDKATGDRVALYKKSKTPMILNYAGQIDRVVGIKTVEALDKELLKSSDPNKKPAGNASEGLEIAVLGLLAIVSSYTESETGFVSYSDSTLRNVLGIIARNQKQNNS